MPRLPSSTTWNLEKGKFQSCDANLCECGDDDDEQLEVLRYREVGEYMPRHLCTCTVLYKLKKVHVVVFFIILIKINMFTLFKYRA